LAPAARAGRSCATGVGFGAVRGDGVCGRGVSVTKQLIELNTAMILLKGQRNALLEAAKQFSPDLAAMAREIADTDDRAIKAMQAVLEAVE